MNQQEFEPHENQVDKEIYPLQYPYTWSGQPHQKGMPRDEPPGTSGTWSGQPGSRADQLGQAQVLTKARPPSRHNDQLVIAAVVALVIFLVLVAGWVGIGSFLPSTLPYLLGVVWGAIVALLVFVFLLVSLILRLILRAVGQGKHHRRSSTHETPPGPQ
jgi:hypothetical protein